MEFYKRRIESGSDKQEILPSEWVERIDQMMVEDYMGANRYFAENAPDIHTAIDRVITTKPSDFYNQLVATWDYHHDFFEKTLQSPLQVLVSDDVALGYNGIELLEEAYTASTEVDKLTLIYSAAIKPHIDHHLDRLAEKYNIEPQDFLQRYLNTRTFFAYHDYMNIAQAMSDAPDTRQLEQLASEFHAGSLPLAEVRFQALRDKYDFMTANEVREILDKPVRNEDKPDNFSDEDWAEVRSLQKILEFDNLEEYLIATNLEGLSGYILRKKTYGLLQDKGIIEEREGIYAYSDAEILEGLEQIRRENEVIIPKRQYGLTCSAACAAMVESHFVGTPLNDTLERKYDQLATSKYMEGQHYSWLAAALSSYGVDVELVHQEEELFTQGSLPRHSFDLLMQEYKQGLKHCEDLGVPITNGNQINTTFINTELAKGKTIILAGKLSRDLYHSVLVTGIDENNYNILDPINGKRSKWSARKLSQFSSTDIGKWCILVNGNAKLSADITKRISDYGKNAQNNRKMLYY